MRVVVTGIAGRIGRAIAECLAREHDVVGLDRLPGSTAVHHVGDVVDRELLAAAFAGAHAVVHVAALHAPHVGVVPDAELERVNIEGTRAVASVARAAGIRRIVFTSTTALYGLASQARGRARWIDEDVEPSPITIYHRTKLAAEQVLRDAADDSLQIRILRMSRCFPEPADVMGIYRLHRGIDARDVATAHAAALVHAGEAHHTWVISGQTPFEEADLPALAEDAPAVLRARAPDLVAAYQARSWPLPASIDRVYVPARAMQELAWRPRHGFAEVLAMLDQGCAEVLAPRDVAAVPAGSAPTI
jgi:nucleoside-diphosphate-sugar epimerase